MVHRRAPTKCLALKLLSAEQSPSSCLSDEGHHFTLSAILVLPPKKRPDTQVCMPDKRRMLISKSQSESFFLRQMEFLRKI